MEVLLFQASLIAGSEGRLYIVQKLNDTFNPISGRFLSSVLGILPSLVLIPAWKDYISKVLIKVQISNLA